MSETKIVNRVSSPGLDADLRDAGLETTETEVSQPEFVEGLGETILSSVWNAPVGEKVIKTGLVPRDPDLVKFREQVISAFRHLGLDTNKFFGV